MSNAVGRTGRSYHGADFRRLVGCEAASFRLRRLTLPDGEVDSEVLAVAFEDRDGEVAEVRGAADGVRLVLVPSTWGEVDMDGLGQITEHPLNRKGRIAGVRHILGTRSTELILRFASEPSWSILNQADRLSFREVMPE